MGWGLDDYDINEDGRKKRLYFEKYRRYEIEMILKLDR